MTSSDNQTSPKRRLLLASDRGDQSSELADILQSVGEVDTIATSDIPDAPASDLSGIVVDINLRSPESVQQVRNKLRGEAYRAMPRLFVLADALHHGTDSHPRHFNATLRIKTSAFARSAVSVADRSICRSACLPSASFHVS